MADFSNISKKSVFKETAVYIFYDIDGAPELTVKPATELNKPFFNAVLRNARKTGRNTARTAATIANDRNNDRKLYAQHIVMGWNKVVDVSDKPVAFNRDDCLNFLEALDDYQFDGLREFCANQQNFREDEEEELDVDTTAKN